MLASMGGSKKEQSYRLLSKDSSLQNPSFRVYYSDKTGAVPFEWEIQPGTPKHPSNTAAAAAAAGPPTVIPPLTPPPSHLVQPTTKQPRQPVVLKSASFSSFFTRLRKQKSPTPTTKSPTPTTLTPSLTRRRSLRWASSASAASTSSTASSSADDADSLGSPKSVSCFRVGSDRISFAKMTTPQVQHH